MRFRWTIDDLKERTDNGVILGVLHERTGDLNPYTPFARRLKAIIAKLDKQRVYRQKPGKPF